MNPIRFFAFAVLLILATSGAQAITSAYTDELSNPGEQCSLQDQFWYKSEDKQLYASVIQCCANGSCTLLFVDEQANYQFGEEGAADADNVYHVRNMMRDGSFSENIYLMHDSFEICSFFDYKVLRDNSIGAGAKGVEYGTKLLYPKAAKDVSTITKLMEFAGFSFNPIEFTAAVACTSNIDAHQQAMQKLAECYDLATKIRNGWVEYGAVHRLEVCNGEAKAIIEPILKSLKEVLGNALSTLGNVAKGLWDFSVGNDKEINIKKTEYQQLEEFYNKISVNPNLEDPNANTIGRAAVLRVEQKKQETAKAITNATIALNSVKDLDEFTPVYFVKNLFLEHNYDYKAHKATLRNASALLKSSKEYRDARKYNTAIRLANEAEGLSYREVGELGEMNSQPRVFDPRWKTALIVIAVIIVIAVLLAWYILREKGGI